MVYTHGVPNFDTVEPGLYRSGEPRADGWLYLRDELHIGARIALDFPSERIAPPPVGLRVIEHAMPPADVDDVIGEVFGREAPSISDVYAAVDEIQLCMAQRQITGRACATGCLHGQDRTGLIIAVSRRRVQHWPKERAWAEALAHGFHTAFRGLVDVWAQVP